MKYAAGVQIFRALALTACCAVAGSGLAGCGSEPEAHTAPHSARPTEAALTLTRVTADREQVRVTGRNLPAGRKLILAECTATTKVHEGPSRACDMARGATAIVKPGDAGDFGSAVLVRTHISTGDGVRREVDCLDGGCVVAAIDGATERIVATAAIRWSAGVKPTGRPTLAVHDLSWDDETGSVAVTGSGFPSRTPVQLVQCPRPKESGSPVDVAAGDCLYDTATSVETDRRGSLRTVLHPFPLFQRSDGELIDCRAHPSGCLIAVPWPKNSSHRMAAVPLG